MANQEPLLLGLTSGIADDFDFWATQLTQSCGAFHPSKPRGFDLQSFIGRVKPTSPGMLSTSFVATNCPHVYRRSIDIRSDDQSFYYLIVQREGRARMCQEDSEADLSPGDLVLLDASKPSDFYHDGISQQLSIILPRHMVNETLQQRDIKSGIRIPRENSCSRLIAHMTGSVWAFDGISIEEELAMQEAITALLKPMLGGSGGDSDSESEQLLRKAMHFIKSNLELGQLTVGMLANELCVSERTVHRLFSRKGMTVARQILEIRLERCAAALSSVKDCQSISLVADRAGFADISHFSRAFKRRYGVSPRAYRKEMIERSA
ncbi:TPA: transcriptional regulator FeaR [Pseudomonas aeruginosa]|nr:transcriptional regulator FeaR [Pseudomonas aeruginosa]